MQKYRIHLLILIVFFTLSLKAQVFSPMLLSEFPDSELFTTYSESKARPDSQKSLANQHTWLVSEKLDGVRGLWDGKQMYFRSGKVMELDSEFTRNFPPFALDGEIYSPDLHFSQIISILKNPKKSAEVIKLQYYVFDVPNHPNQNSGLLERLEILESYLATHPSNFLRIIPQIPMKENQEIQYKLHQVTQNGGEGLVLRDPNAPYQVGRSKKNFKLKTIQDDECKITGYTRGKGKYTHQVGALICSYKDKSFKIGGGLSDELRRNPPPIGAIITFKYQGLTHNQIPRFPRFWRIKEKE